MEYIYKFIELLFPFDWISYTFMKNALIAIILVTPLFGIIGTMIVNNRMAFFSDSLGHSALTGIALGVLIGLKSPLLSMLAFALIFALALTIIKNKTMGSTDTIIGVFSSTAIAIGIVILSKGGGFVKYSAYLIGDLLSIVNFDILFLFIILIIVILLWIVFFNKLFMVSLNKNLAISKGIHVYLYEIGFTAVIAVIVVASIQLVGILVINSLLVLPAAASRNISNNMRQYHFYSILISVISGISGLIISYYLGTATGATIIIIAAAFYFSTLLIKIRQ